MRINFGTFLPDRRGDRLQKYGVVRGKSGRSYLLLRCSEAVAAQVSSAIRCTQRPLPPQLDGDFTHCFTLEGPLQARERDFLELLKEVLTIPTPGPVATTLALDFYKDPDSHEDPMHWANTNAGELVYRGKYCGSDSAGSELTEALAEVARKHPSYISADAVISVPGHISDRPSFGVRLALSVANRLGKTLTQTASSSSQRPQSKDAERGGLTLSGEFVVPTLPSECVAIIVDDVYRSGRTMEAVAAAAVAAGAHRLLGLIGARTMRT